MNAYLTIHFPVVIEFQIIWSNFVALSYMID